MSVVVWEPKAPPPPRPRHVCEEILGRASSYAPQTIKKCQCGKYYYRRTVVVDDDGGPYGIPSTDYYYKWVRVRFYHFKMRSRIREWERKISS